MMPDVVEVGTKIDPDDTRLALRDGRVHAIYRRMGAISTGTLLVTSIYLHPTVEDDSGPVSCSRNSGNQSNQPFL